MNPTVLAGILQLADTVVSLLGNLAGNATDLQKALDAAHAAGLTITAADVQASSAKMNAAVDDLAKAIAAAEAAKQPPPA